MVESERPRFQEVPGSGEKPALQESEEYPLVAIIGPTASGKSSLALDLAARLDGEVVNYDSVQVYRGLNIGSGKLLPAERRGVLHHLIDCREPEENFTAGDFRREALRVLADLRRRGKLPILVGGTGLYLRALMLGLFEAPPRSEALRERLRETAGRRGREFLHRLLRRRDPVAAARIQVRDTQKVIRALEVTLLARRPMTEMHANGRRALRGFRVMKIGLNPDRALLYGRINARVERMFAAGLMDETRALLAKPEADRIKPLGALGYKQARAALLGELSLEDAVRETQAATRRYAKRQMTWFRRESGVIWFDAFGDEAGLPERVLAALDCEMRAGAPRLGPP